MATILAGDECKKSPGIFSIPPRPLFEAETLKKQIKKQYFKESIRKYVESPSRPKAFSSRTFSSVYRTRIL